MVNRPRSLSRAAWGIPQAALAACVMLFAARAHAHIHLETPTSRPNMEAFQKDDPPCGGLTRSNSPTIAVRGTTLSMEWNETIDHPGWYRISWSTTGDEGLLNGVVADEADIPDDQINGTFTYDLALPDITCDTCVVQLVQVMTDPAKLPDPTTPSGFQEYHACADIRLVNPGEQVDDPPADTAGADTAAAGCHSSEANGDGGVLILMVTFLLARRTTGAFNRRSLALLVTI